MSSTQNSPARKPYMHRVTPADILLLFLAAVIVVAAIAAFASGLFGGSRTPDDDASEIPGGEQSLKLETVAWPANKPFTTFSVGDGSLILAGEETERTQDKLTAIYGHATQFVVGGNTQIKMDTAALTAMDTMMAALNTDSTFDGYLTAVTAYSTTATIPDYRTGYTVSFRVVSNVTRPFAEVVPSMGIRPDLWMQENAWRYGVIERFPANSTYSEDGVTDTYRYVGVPHAYYIENVMPLTEEQKVQTLEDYIELVKTKTAKSPLEIKVEGTVEAKDDGTYYVYYIALDKVEGATMPKGTTLVDVSGDGSTGFIVTVKK